MKARADSWYAMLDEAQLWQLYAMAKRANWFEVVAAAQEQFNLTEKVSRSAYYRWLDFMRGHESERRLAQARIAALEIDDISKAVGLKDEKAIQAYKSLAAEIALKGDAKTASQFLRMAMDLKDRQLHSAEVDLKTKDLARKEEELKIAREKFEAAEKRLNAVQEAVNAAKNGAMDPTKVADEIDKILGRKK